MPCSKSAVIVPQQQSWDEWEKQADQPDYFGTQRAAIY